MLLLNRKIGTVTHVHSDDICHGEESCETSSDLCEKSGIADFLVLLFNESVFEIR
jgi:hypothetical protein